MRKSKDNLIPIVEHIIKAKGSEVQHAFQVRKLALNIFLALAKYEKFLESDQKLLECAALLHDLGLFCGSKGHHKNSEKAIINLDLPLSLTEKQMVAAIARYHRKKFPSVQHKNYAGLSKIDQIRVNKLSTILRLADGLDRSHLNKVEKVEIIRTGDKYIFEIYSKDQFLTAELYGFQKKQDFWEKYYKIKIEIKILSDIT